MIQLNNWESWYFFLSRYSSVRSRTNHTINIKILKFISSFLKRRLIGFLKKISNFNHLSLVFQISWSIIFINFEYSLLLNHPRFLAVVYASQFTWVVFLVLQRFHKRQILKEFWLSRHLSLSDTTNYITSIYSLSPFFYFYNRTNYLFPTTTFTQISPW